MAAEGDRPAMEAPAEATDREASGQDRPPSATSDEPGAPAPLLDQRPGWTPNDRGPGARSGPGGHGPSPGQSGRGGARRGGPFSDRQGGPRSGGPRDGRDERRRRRDGREGPDRRPYAGFGDEIDRAVCLAFQHAVPPAFPVQHRHGVATLRMAIVARRADAFLLCDGGHPGPHLWPDGEPVGSAAASGHTPAPAPSGEQAAARGEAEDQTPPGTDEEP
jgi:hypothetical protein